MQTSQWTDEDLKVWEVLLLWIPTLYAGVWNVYISAFGSRQFCANMGKTWSFHFSGLNWSDRELCTTHFTVEICRKFSSCMNNIFSTALNHFQMRAKNINGSLNIISCHRMIYLFWIRIMVGEKLTYKNLICNWT